MGFVEGTRGHCSWTLLLLSQREWMGKPHWAGQGGRAGVAVGGTNNVPCYSEWTFLPGSVVKTSSQNSAFGVSSYVWKSQKYLFWLDGALLGRGMSLRGHCPRRCHPGDRKQAKTEPPWTAEGGRCTRAQCWCPRQCGHQLSPRAPGDGQRAPPDLASLSGSRVFERSALPPC